MNEKITILYIDDEPLNLMLFTQLFKDYNIITGISGYEGLDKLKQYSEIKIIFSDMKMPGMNGIEFAIQAKKENHNKTFFLITGYDINEEIANAIQNKTISGYFRKPFDVEKIRKSIYKLTK